MTCHDNKFINLYIKIPLDVAMHAPNQQLLDNTAFIRQITFLNIYKTNNCIRAIIFRRAVMKKEIHPEYNDIKVSCVCGESFETKSTKNISKIDICSKCHPFYTGKQKILDTEGRIEKFRKKFGDSYTNTKKKK